MNSFHHLAIYGCKNPGLEDNAFNCGHMGKMGNDPNYKRAKNACNSGSQLMYAWSKGKPELELPEGVAFRASGTDTNIDWLVLQVHYGSVDNMPEEGDKTGVIVHYTMEPQPRTAGVLGTITLGSYPARVKFLRDRLIKNLFSS